MDRPPEPRKRILPHRGSAEDLRHQEENAASRLVETGVGGTVIPPWSTKEK